MVPKQAGPVSRHKKLVLWKSCMMLWVSSSIPVQRQMRTGYHKMLWKRWAVIGESCLWDMVLDILKYGASILDQLYTPRVQEKVPSSPGLGAKFKLLYPYTAKVDFLKNIYGTITKIEVSHCDDPSELVITILIYLGAYNLPSWLLSRLGLMWRCTFPRSSLQE